MENISKQARWLIDTLSDFQRTHKEPRNIVNHLNRLPLHPYGEIEEKFFRYIYNLLRKNVAQFDNYTASEFKQYLEKEFYPLAEDLAECRRDYELKEAERLRENNEKA